MAERDDVTASLLDEHRLRRLLEVGRGLVSELDPEAVLRRLLDVARELTGARYAALGVLDASGEELERFITSGVDRQTHLEIGELPRGRGVLGELIREARPLRLDLIDRHPRSYGFPRGHPPMTTFLGMPIVVRGEAWGNLYLTDREDGPFDARDEESLGVLAEWAGVAISNSRLHAAGDLRRDELERAVRRLEASTTIATAIGGETDLARVLELIAKRSRALVDARAVVVLLAEGDDLVVAASAGESNEELLRLRMPIAGSVPGDVLRMGRPERMTEVEIQTHFPEGDLTASGATALMVPLTFRGQSSGVLAAFDRLSRTPEFDAEDELMLRSFATSAATAVATAQTVQQDRLRDTIDAAERERGRWARELHDETLQGLAALRLLLDGARGRDAGLEEAVAQASSQIGAEVQKLQALITELRPAALDQFGLGPALENLAEHARVTQGFDVTVRIELSQAPGDEAGRLDPEVESTVYRLVQEALTNAGKHSAATRASVSVREADGQISIEVTDDGRGFDPEEGTAGFGLIGMRERVGLLGGTLRIDSAPGRGAAVRATVPIRAARP